MALVDFYQLAVLYNLSRDHAGVLSNCSYPPPTPTAGPSSSRLPAVGPHQTISSLFPIPQSDPGTPRHNRIATRPTVDATPKSHGTTVLPKLRLDGDETPKCDIDKYEEYIVQDFERYRVFVDIEVFMKHVLRVPKNWRETWGPTIKQIKRDGEFSRIHIDYSNKCGVQGVKECDFYKLLVDMRNTILKLSESSPNNAVKPITPQRYLRNDPRRILGGVMNNLSPDVVAVHKGLLPYLRSQEREGGCLKESNLTWAQPLQALEVKPWNSALVDGSCMPRLKVNGRDPQTGHAHPHTPSRFLKTSATAGQDNKAYSAPNLPVPLKRAADLDEPLELDRKSQKLHYESTPGGGNGQNEEARVRKPRTRETEQQKDAYLQAGRYLLEQFSVPIFRSHATIGLVDRDRIQFYHANHSVILVSSAINFSTNESPGGLDKFIAIVIAFSRLSLSENGILHNLNRGKLFRDNEKLLTCGPVHGEVHMQEGNKLEFGGDKKTGPFTLTFGKVISHEPSLAGRSTAVLHAKSSMWKDMDLVVKISWPGSERVAESEFIDAAIKKAKSSAEHKWALNHLPRVLFAQDVVFNSESTHERVASLFDDAQFVNGDYKYERRTLRIIIQERLYPVKTLSNVKDIGQVMLDVACVHRWLYECVGILHRDLSMNNIMYRIIEGKAHGVLTDYDLASWTKTLTGDYTKTSQQRTGTPPFMAHGLLYGADALHLYRHDVESLFYIILILATHYEIEAPKKGKAGGLRMRNSLEELPYQSWFDQPDYKILAHSKRFFFSSFEHLDMSPSFEVFRDWLMKLWEPFSCGFAEANQHQYEKAKGVSSSFNNETLGGHVHYSTLIDPVRHLEGELKDLIIRYDRRSPSLPTSTSSAQADA